MILVAVVAVGVAGMAAMTEAVLRFTGRPGTVDIGWASTINRPEELNQFGFRGHHFDDSADLRLILLGDSQVEAVKAPYDDMPEVQLRRVVAQRAAGTISVASIGAGGWGQDQELLALQKSVGAIRPSAVVLWFTEHNDLWNNTFPTSSPKNGTPKPTFWLDGKDLQGPNLPWLTEYRSPGLFLVRAMRRAIGLLNYPSDDDWERRLPAAYRAVAAPPGTPLFGEALAKWRDVRVEDVPFKDEDFETEKTQYSVYPVPESPRLAYAAALTRALLLRIQSLCEANGAKFFVLTTERWDLYPVPDAPTLFDVNGKGYMLSKASAQSVIDRVLEGLPTIRVTGIPHDAVVSKLDAHWNVQGNQYVMEWVGRELATRLH